MTKRNETSPAHSPPTLACHGEEFLDSEECRPLRVLSECLQPLRAFQHHRDHGPIVIFGSARFGAESALARHLDAAIPRRRAQGVSQ